MGFLSRLPNSNDPPKNSSNPWGSKNPEIIDDTAILLNEMGKRCSNSDCKRVVLNAYLKMKGEKYYCPDCYQS